MVRSSRSAASQEETSGTLASFIQRAIPSTAKGTVSAILAFGGILSLLVGTLFWLFFLELKGTSYTVLAIGGILILVAALISFTAVRQSITGRRGRYSSNTAVMVIAFVTLGLLIYLVGARNPIRWDVTATQQFSLAPQTLSILENLSEPIQITAFFVPGKIQHEPMRAPVENLIDEFSHRSDGRLEYRFVDPELEPTLAIRYGVIRYPTLVFEGLDSGRIHRLPAPLFEERDFASALLIVTGVERKTVYFLTGHGERSTEDTAPDSHDGFGLAASGMVTDNYSIGTLSFSQNPAIPEDAAAIIIPGPTRDLPEESMQLLHNYLRTGGRILLLLEPNPPQAMQTFLNRWGLRIRDGIIVDLGSSLAGQPQTPLIQQEQFFVDTPQSQSIVSPLDQTYFPGSVSFESILPGEEMPNTIRLIPLARTTILSCVTMDVNVKTCPGLSPTLLIPAMAVQASAPINEEPAENASREGRLVVFGDTDFASNYHLYSLSNTDLLLNSVNWLTEDVSLASVRPKPITFRQIVVTSREMQVIRGLGWFLLPVLMGLFAGVVWWRRR